MVNKLIEQEVMSEDRTDNISCQNSFKVGLEKLEQICDVLYALEERDRDRLKNRFEAMEDKLKRDE